MSDSARPHRRQPTKLPHPWDSPGKNTGVGCHFLLQGIFSTQGSNLGLPRCRQTLFLSEPPGKPYSCIKKNEIISSSMTWIDLETVILSEVSQTGKGEFYSDEHFIYYCRQESLKRNGVALIVKKSPKCSTWVQSQKQQNDLSLFPRQTIQYHSDPSLCPNK